ncbi:hypothetical protein QR680_009987 [Steinernema hermaphroditum]|uniref:Lipid-binding serum glycoprotein C-terminal domain-containing protein n=1 Tax=Steinernema hermaphroditum TaxID=289476 RepID=A0AA39IMC6_9BILA|nr:hypothetical protein QR680_009987 [Steinernema hermaphroditum]
MIVLVLLFLPAFVICNTLRDRPRGLGLLRLPQGATDERSAPVFPNLYIAGNKAGRKPQTVPDIHLPGQTGRFTGKTSFNPFTHQLAVALDEHRGDDWGVGYAISNNNLLGIDVRQNFELLKNVKFNRNDGMYQPFIHSFVVGGDFDFKRYSEVAGSLDLPIVGVNEMFDLDGGILAKSSRVIGDFDFPLTLSDPGERLPMSMSIVRDTVDRQLHFGHVIPNVNLYLIDRKTIMRHLANNRLNPTVVG